MTVVYPSLQGLPKQPQGIGNRLLQNSKAVFRNDDRQASAVAYPEPAEGWCCGFRLLRGNVNAQVLYSYKITQ